MGKFSAAALSGGSDMKQQNMFNYLIELLETGYVAEGLIDNHFMRVSITPKDGLAFYDNSVYRGGTVIRNGELTLLTDIIGTVDDAYHYVKFDKHALYGSEIDMYSLLKIYTSDNAASPSPIEALRIASHYWESTDTAQTFFGLAPNGTTVDAVDIYLSAGMCLETPVGSAYINLNSSPASDSCTIKILAINPSENSSGIQIYANTSTPRIEVMVNYTDVAKWLDTKLEVYTEILSSGSFNRGSWNAPTAGAITQLVDNAGDQSSVLVGRNAGGTRYYGIDLLNSTTPAMRLYVGSGYVSIAASAITFNGESIWHNTNLPVSSGSFTPALRGSTTAGTWAWTNQTGSYYLIGKICHVAIRLKPSSISGSPAGYLQLTGLPYNAGVSGQHMQVMSAGLSWGTNMTQIQLYMDSGSNTALFYGTYNNGNYAALDVSSIVATDTILISGCYRIA